MTTSTVRQDASSYVSGTRSSEEEEIEGVVLRELVERRIAELRALGTERELKNRMKSKREISGTHVRENVEKLKLLLF